MKYKLILRRAAALLSALALAGGVWILCRKSAAETGLPMPFGVGAAVVLSGSMEPTLSKGDLIFIKRADTVDPGDIVVFQSGSGLVVHRAISVDADTVVTQGDANNTADDPVDMGRVRGVVRLCLPGVGTALSLLKTPAGIAAVSALTLGLWGLSLRKERQREKRRRADGGE